MVLHSAPEKGKATADESADHVDDVDDVMGEEEDRDNNGLHAPAGEVLVRACLSAGELSALARLECEVRGPQVNQTLSEEEGMCLLASEE